MKPFPNSSHDRHSDALRPACPACDIVSGRAPTLGGPLLEVPGFLLHAVTDPSPTRGWVVLTSTRHVRGLMDLSETELAALGPLTARIMRAQRAALGADHVYAFAIGEVLEHFHLHLVPRFPETPAHLRGRKCFEGRPEDFLPEPELRAAVERLRGALEAS